MCKTIIQVYYRSIAIAKLEESKTVSKQCVGVSVWVCQEACTPDTGQMYTG